MNPRASNPGAVFSREGRNALMAALFKADVHVCFTQAT